MTTPNDTTPATDPTNRTTDDTSPRSIPGRTPITEEAGAPIVPTPRLPTADTDRTDRTDRTDSTDTPTTAPTGTRRPSPPPTAEERDAPLVPDLRPTRRSRADGRSR
ncbi:hypothetical protein C461_09816 [Halorubrum aidingense JCM 13560]|uniref:Uncharacterized protein n=1 Tax=Halorubrum aidingense JCM 13560 TaxID=1230454 RepID=M0PAB0_9EURY|nr:hypothetical protein [Halorubrum aidingense]EMA66798.1 hypothetical protein C461_09816 [Halorubrum aidingense JCM 13560]